MRAQSDLLGQGTDPRSRETVQPSTGTVRFHRKALRTAGPRGRLFPAVPVAQGVRVRLTRTTTAAVPRLRYAEVGLMYAEIWSG